jgi:hypothetical protein
MPVRASLEINNERCQDFRNRVSREISRGASQGGLKAGRRQHSKRFELATRISRVSQTRPIWIGALTIVWVAVFLRVIQAARRWVSVRTAYRELPTSRPWCVRPFVTYASFAASFLPRRRAPGFRCLTRFPGELPSQRGLRFECGASCDDRVDPSWEPCHTIKPPRRVRRMRGLLV